MKDRVKNGAILVLFVVVCILLLLRSCDGKVEKTVNQNDTTYVTKIDTVYPAPDTITFAPIHLTVYKKIRDTVNLEVCKYINIYKDSLSDPNLVIYYTDSVKGQLLDKQLSYKLKVPKTITITEREFINKYITTNKEKTTIYGGVMLGATAKGQITNLLPVITLKYKKNLLYYGYGIFDQSHNVGVSVKLFNKKK